MGTRSRIGVMHGDKCKSVYANWDGYLSGVGATLQEHYDSAKANHLVALGDLSILKETIGEKHNFSDHYQDGCTFYGRDRGEKDVDFQVSHDFAQFLELVDGCGAEYFYIMKDGVWYCGAVYAVEGMKPNTLCVLQEQLAKQTA